MDSAQRSLPAKALPDRLTTPQSQDISFWKWISPSTLGIVTDTAVYHWPATGETPPSKVFERHANLAGHQIINYRASSDEKWLVLVGIASNTAPDGFKIKGSLQLYSKERGVSQPIEGHAASFANIHIDGSPAETKLFTFANRTATGAKVGWANLPLYIVKSLAGRHEGTEMRPPLHNDSSTSLKSTTLPTPQCTPRRP